MVGFGAGRGADHKGATQGNLEDYGTTVGKYMTTHFSKPIQLCNSKVEFYRIQVKSNQTNQSVAETKDGIQTMVNESNFIANE